MGGGSYAFPGKLVETQWVADHLRDEKGDRNEKDCLCHFVFSGVDHVAYH